LKRQMFEQEQEWKIRAIQDGIDAENEALEQSRRQYQQYFGVLLNNNMSWGEKMTSIAQQVALNMAATGIGGLATKVGGSSSTFGNILGALSTSLMGFSSGGIVPGQYSQPKPIMAHGNEMVLNPGQQKTLWEMANGKGNTEKQSGANYVYAPQIKTGASAEEVFKVLDSHSRQFFAKISDGVRTDARLRNAVRGS